MYQQPGAWKLQENKVNPLSIRIHISECLLFDKRCESMIQIKWENGNLARTNLINGTLCACDRPHISNFMYEMYEIYWVVLSFHFTNVQTHWIHRNMSKARAFDCFAAKWKKKDDDYLSHKAHVVQNTCSHTATTDATVTSLAHWRTHRTFISNLDIIVEMMVNWKAHNAGMPETLIEFSHSHKPPTMSLSLSINLLNAGHDIADKMSRLNRNLSFFILEIYK